MNTGKRRKRTAGIIWLVTVNLIVAGLLLEFAGIAYFYYTNHQLFYFRQQGAGQTADLQFHTVHTAKKPLTTKLVLHPYLGYIYRPGLPLSVIAGRQRLKKLLGGYKHKQLPGWTTFRANRFGFYSDVDYPYDKQKNEYVIAVFGGSVAHWFALQGSSMLISELIKSNYFKEREITVLNFAQGGFKQPQQLLALAYFLSLGQKFDFILNIDGFNELVLSQLNTESSIDPSLPSGQHLLSVYRMLSSDFTDSELISAAYLLSKANEALTEIHYWQEHNISAGVYLLLKLLEAKHIKELSAARTRLDDLKKGDWPHDLISVMPWQPPKNDENIYRPILQNWFNSSLAMQYLCSSMQIPYLEVVQPNQYYSRKKFSELEASLALNKASPYRIAAAKGYKVLDSKLPDAVASGLNIVSAIDIFNKTSEIVFSDDCCHYNQRGNDILAEFIADKIVRYLRNKSRQ
ncbi:MAG: hypothetical protein D6719_02425 [Candidatus Dadabacteria bacterium]|nr:MAG: hypothetical protein D6719_02425 [Candidatus Dadabacteria bacterium]